jgi:hypothetical protein
VKLQDKNYPIEWEEKLAIVRGQIDLKLYKLDNNSEEFKKVE